MLNKDLQTFKADDIIILSKRKEGYKMTRVLVNGNMDGALRKFKQKVARSGVPSEFKKREHFQNTSGVLSVINRLSMRLKALKKCRQQPKFRTLCPKT